MLHGGGALTDLSGPYTYSSALGEDGCVAGTYRAEVDGWKFEWSDGMFQLHGYRRGEVVPSLELLFAHKHPEDRPNCEAIVARVVETGGYFCMYHRIIDARGRTRRVVTSGEGVVGPDGKVAVIEGVMVDLTSTLQRETEQTARDAVAGATATRTVIDQARGILMGRLNIGSDEAFNLLVSTSSHRNVKLVAVAAELVQLANSDEARQYLPAAVKAIVEQARPAAADRPAASNRTPATPSRSAASSRAASPGRQAMPVPAASPGRSGTSGRPPVPGPGPSAGRSGIPGRPVPGPGPSGGRGAAPGRPTVRGRRQPE